MENRETRDYVRKYGKAAARQRLGNGELEKISVQIDGLHIGSVHRFWHPMYSCWVHRGITVIDFRVYDYISFNGEPEAMKWVQDKYNAMKDPIFTRMLSDDISASGYSIDAIAIECGCSRDVIYKWIRGESVPSVVHLHALAKALHPQFPHILFQKYSNQIILERK